MRESLCERENVSMWDKGKNVWEKTDQEGNIYKREKNICVNKRERENACE